jgi:hypothetical protein
MEALKSTVNWTNSLPPALERSRSEKKPVLLDFFKEG